MREKQVARNFNEIARDIFRNNDNDAKFRRLEVWIYDGAYEKREMVVR